MAGLRTKPTGIGASISPRPVRRPSEPSKHDGDPDEENERPISLIDMADDMATVLGKLGYRQVDALGYSMGGGVAFRLAVQHPAQVRRLALVSAGYAQDGFYPEMLPQQAQDGKSNAPSWANQVKQAR